MTASKNLKSQIIPFISGLLTQAPPEKTLLIGICGPQGIGKSTVCRKLTDHFGSNPKTPALSISIDDFYLTRSEQIQLAKAHPDNPYLQNRGYAGTHDVELGTEVLKKCLAQKPIAIPRYDKSLHSGKGDRTPESQWTNVKDPQKLIFLEGWMLAYEPKNHPVSPASLNKTNELLKNYSAWTKLVDAWVLLFPENNENVFQWRAEAEKKMIQEKGSGMSEKEIRDYLKLFFPAYELYIPALKEKNFTIPTQKFVLNLNREIIG